MPMSFERNPSIWLSNERKLASFEEINKHHLDSSFHQKRNPLPNRVLSTYFVPVEFYPVYADIATQTISISVPTLLHYRVTDVIPSLTASVVVGDRKELTHLVSSKHGLLYLPQELELHSFFRLVLHVEDHIVDEITLKVSSSSHWNYPAPLPPSLQFLKQNDSAFHPRVYDCPIIERNSFLPKLSPNYYLNSISLGSVIQFKVIRNVFRPTIVLYNEHNRSSHSQFSQVDNLYRITIPEHFGTPGQLMRLYIYDSSMLLDELYFMLSSPAVQLPPLRQSPLTSLIHQSKLIECEIKSRSNSNSSSMPYRSASFSVPDSRDDCLPPVRSASFPAFNNLFESSVLNESLMGRVSVDLQIRQKRRGQWFETNVNPSKIGKMRRCVLKFSKIIRSATVTIESSDPETVKLSQWGKSSTDGSQEIKFNVEPSKDTEIQFYIVPLSGATSSFSSVKAVIQFPSCSPIVIHQWKLIVANHKFESSHEGINQSRTNNDSIVYYLFCNENTKKVALSCSESESHLIDSLYLLRNHYQANVDK